MIIRDQKPVAVELELTQEGYARICDLTDRYAAMGGNVSLSAVISLALLTGLQAMEETLNQIGRERMAPHA